MNISYKWLSEFLELRLTSAELSSRLTSVGLAVEGIHRLNDDEILDLDLTSNRPDCLSHLGVAREVSAIQGTRLVEPQFEITAGKGSTSDCVNIEVRDPELCPRYSAHVVRGVQVGPSPDWLVNRLESIGQRAINNVADITNLVLHELGQPLHAFDLRKLAGPAIVVRRAAENERLKTLDGVERQLDPSMLVIADAERAVALAGVMGGLETEISKTTTDVLIESAYFLPASVRATARKLGMHTEASHRFERGTDPQGVLRAQERCVSLICQIAGGAPTIETIDVYPSPAKPVEVFLRRDRINVLTGVEVPANTVENILGSLGFDLVGKQSAVASEFALDTSGTEDLHVHRSDTMRYLSPSWRVDIEREEDLIEEVIRHIGFDSIESNLPAATLAGEYHPAERRRRALRSSLRSSGFDEAINFSFIEASASERIEFEAGSDGLESELERFVTLRNPIIEGADRMRPTLLPGLLQSVRHNFNHGSRDVSLYEVGVVFGAAGIPGDLPSEHEVLGLAMSGALLSEECAAPIRERDFFDLKGAVDAAVRAISALPLRYDAAQVRHLRAGQAASLYLGETLIGTAGRLSDDVASIYKFKQPVYLAELNLSKLLATESQTPRYIPIPRFPGVVRDSSLIVSRKLSFDDLLAAIAQGGSELCRKVTFVATYEGSNIPAGKRSVTLRFEYRADDRTLIDNEVDHDHERIVSHLKSELGAEIRN